MVWLRHMRLGGAGAVLALLIGATALRADEARILNASYDPTRELYRAINAAFVADWKATTGETVTVQTSHAGSGKQARAVIDELDADVVTLALAADIDAIVAKSGKIPAHWQRRLQNNSSPYTSTIVFLVRKGNPKKIKDWDDLAKPGVSVITPNPKTSGGARWNYLAAWAYATKKLEGDESKTKEFVGKIYKNTSVLDSGARGSTVSFAQHGLGDVLITWENEAFLAYEDYGRGKFDIVVPSISIRAEPPVTLVDANVDLKGTRKVATAYLEFLYSPTAQALIAKNYYRPFKPEAADPADLARFAKLELAKIDQDFGGWAKAQAKHFADGGIFDQIYVTH